MPITATVCPEDSCVLHVKKIKENKKHVYLKVKAMFNHRTLYGIRNTRLLFLHTVHPYKDN